MNAFKICIINRSIVQGSSVLAKGTWPTKLEHILITADQIIPLRRPRNVHLRPRLRAIYLQMNMGNTILYFCVCLRDGMASGILTLILSRCCSLKTGLCMIYIRVLKQNELSDSQKRHSCKVVILHLGLASKGKLASYLHLFSGSAPSNAVPTSHRSQNTYCVLVSSW